MTLFTSQHQQLRVRSEHFAHSILKFATRIDLLLDFLHPLFGDALGVLSSARHERQGPRRVAFVLRAMASGLPTTGSADN